MEGYDYSKLLGALKAQGYTQKTFSERIGISACSLNLTLKNKRNFRQDEILQISKVLKIPASQFHAYFFARKL